jgi:hypothetical protein
VGKRLRSNLGVVIGAKIQRIPLHVSSASVLGSHVALEPKIVEEDSNFKENWNSQKC